MEENDTVTLADTGDTVVACDLTAPPVGSGKAGGLPVAAAAAVALDAAICKASHKLVPGH